MGNHEHPCVVCGENTMSAFNYDCEQRHNTKAIKAEMARVSRYCKGNCNQSVPCKYHDERITELAALLMKRPRHELESPDAL